MISAFGVEHGDEVSKRKQDPDRGGKVFGSPVKTAAVVGGGAALLAGRGRRNAVGEAVGNRMVRRSLWSAGRTKDMKNAKLISGRKKYAVRLHQTGSNVRRNEDTKELTGAATIAAGTGAAAGGIVYGRKRLTPVQGQ